MGRIRLGSTIGASSNVRFYLLNRNRVPVDSVVLTLHSIGFSNFVSLR